MKKTKTISFLLIVAFLLFANANAIFANENNLNKEIYENIASQSKGISTLETNIAEYDLGQNTIANLTDEMINLTDPIEQSYRPINASGKSLVFTFDNLYDIKSIKIHNSNANNSKILGSTINFIYEQNGQKNIHSHIIDDDSNIIEISPNQDISYNKIEIIFNEDTQDLREIEIFGKENSNFYLKLNENFQNIALQSKELVTITTTISNYLTSVHGMANINDGDLSVEKLKDFAYHPLNTSGKSLIFNFNSLYNIKNIRIHNATQSNQDKIVGTTVLFYNLETENYRTVIDDNDDIININVKEDLEYDKVVFLFENDTQNLREIEIIGKRSSTQTQSQEKENDVMNLMDHLDSITTSFSKNTEDIKDLIDKDASTYIKIPSRTYGENTIKLKFSSIFEDPTIEVCRVKNKNRSQEIIGAVIYSSEKRLKYMKKFNIKKNELCATIAVDDSKDVVFDELKILINKSSSNNKNPIKISELSVYINK